MSTYGITSLLTHESRRCQTHACRMNGMLETYTADAVSFKKLKPGMLKSPLVSRWELVRDINKL